MVPIPPRKSAAHRQLASGWLSGLLSLSIVLGSGSAFIAQNRVTLPAGEPTGRMDSSPVTTTAAIAAAQRARVVKTDLHPHTEPCLVNSNRWARLFYQENIAQRHLPLAWFQARLESADRSPQQESAGLRKSRDEAWEKEVNETAQDELARMPWYDRQSEQVQPLPVRPPRDLQNRLSRWERGPEINTTWDWRLPSFLSPILEALAWLALLTVLLVIAYLLIRGLMDSDLISKRSATWVQQDLDGEADRVEALPVQLKRPQGDLLAEARRHYEAGEWDEAMIYLYSYQLLQLDKAQLIRLTRGKTNRQYLRELTRNGGPVDLMTQSVVAFEDVFFGRHPLGRQRFEACWNRLEEFQRAVATEPVNA